MKEDDTLMLSQGLQAPANWYKERAAFVSDLENLRHSYALHINRDGADEAIL